LFKILEWIPSTSAKAKALRVVYLEQMLNALVYAIEHMPNRIDIIEINDIRKMND
jgi:hypothetical protein